MDMDAPDQPATFEPLRSWGVAGIDPHKHTFTVAVLDERGGLHGVASFPTSDQGLGAALAWLGDVEFDVDRVGVEGSGWLGVHVATFLAAAGYDVREVQASRTAERRRRRRRAKTDAEDAQAIARETLAHPDLPPAGKQHLPDLDWDELVAMRNRRRGLLAQRQRLLNEAESVLVLLPLVVRGMLPPTSRVRPRLRVLAQGAADHLELAPADRVNLAWLADSAVDIHQLDARIRQLDERIPAVLARLGCTLAKEVGIAAVGAMQLLVEVGDPTRFASEARFARWCGVAPLAVSSGEGDGEPERHRLDLGGNRQVNSMLHTMHVTQARCYQPAKDYLRGKRAEHKTSREARRAHKRQLANVVIRHMWADHQRRMSQAANVPNQTTPRAA
jgi:transposase